MSTQKPREFWIERTPIDHFTHVAISVLPPGFTDDQLNEVIHVREVLPQDDSIRVNKIHWNELTAAIGMDDLNKAAYWAERIERESEEAK